MREIREIVLHCSASDRFDQTAEMIRRWQMAPDFPGGPLRDIAYHYFIRMNGQIERGRPENVVGAGIKGRNANSLHICVAGDRDFRPMQFDSLQLLLRSLAAKYPNATLHGHREFDGQGKTCPNFAYGWLRDFWNEHRARANKRKTQDR